MKVVFDTNVSALTLLGGRGDQALQRVVAGNDSLALSKPILDELLSSVLARKFARDREELARVANFLADLGELSNRPGGSRSSQTSRTTVSSSAHLPPTRSSSSPATEQCLPLASTGAFESSLSRHISIDRG